MPEENANCVQQVEKFVPLEVVEILCEEKKFMKDDCNFHEQKNFSTRRS